MNKSLSKLDFRVACCFNILIGIWHISLEHWKMLIRWCRNNIYSYKLSAKVSLMLDSPFLVPFLVNWTISVFVSSRLAQNYLQTAYSLQGKQCFFWSHPQCFGPLVKSVSYDYAFIESCRRIAAFTKIEPFHRDLNNIYFDIKGYLFRTKAFGGCFWNKWIQTYVSDT